jgi:hypothetical protein
MPPQQKQRKMAIVGSRSVGMPPSHSRSSGLQPGKQKHPPCKQLTTHLLATGKSSLTVQYVDGHFVDSYYPTIENTFSKVIRYRNHDFAVEMIDTAGQDEYSILNSKHFIGIHGYMIVYSVGSKQSFEMVRIIRDKILNHLVCFFLFWRGCILLQDPLFFARAHVALLYMSVQQQQANHSSHRSSQQPFHPNH